MSRSYIVIGLGYGDEGKGSWVEHLVRKHDLKYVVRFNGGAQARHHVVTPEGITHPFSQFSSGTLVPGTKTLLSRFMLVEPLSLMAEAQSLEEKGVTNVLGRMFISENAPLITPFNMILNQIMEIQRGNARHGSCGYGIGITQADVEMLRDDAFYVRDIGTPGAYDKLVYLWNLRLEKAREFKSEKTKKLLSNLELTDIRGYLEILESFKKAVTVISDRQMSEILEKNAVVFEGAQGVLLDQKFGTFPHCTRSNCTFENAETLLREAGVTDYERIGLLRGYMTRHGAGPFVTQTEIKVHPCLNAENVWQGDFHVGWFDAVAARYAIDCVGGVSSLVITNLDRMTDLPEVRICVGYTNADRRFFTSDSIKNLNGEFSQRALQTESLNAVEPIYQRYSAWKSCDEDALIAYLDAISYHVQVPVKAYSSEITHHKVYLEEFAALCKQSSQHEVIQI